MKPCLHFKVFVALMSALSLFGLTNAALAKSINLYEQPIPGAKVVGTIDPASGVIPIFTPKGGDWVKIGDPSNGNVGWVKSSDIANGSSFSFTQKIIKSGEEPQEYKLQIGNPSNVKLDKQSQDLMHDIQRQQQAIQGSTQKFMQEMIDNINRLYKQQPQLLHNNGTMPVIMPIVIVPASSLQKVPNQPAPVKK